MDYRKSIRTRLLALTLVVLLTLTTVLGASSVGITNRLSREASEQLITTSCAEEALRVDNKLNLVRHSATMIYQYACELQQVGHLDPLSSDFEKQVKDLAIAAANDTEGAMAVYFRYDPALTGSGTSGFFWSRMDPNGKFTEEPPTDILAYNATDIEHVGWFYTPKNEGEPMWMAPYLNKNLNVFMISYIIPLYRDNGDFLGVIGMDIDFDSIINTACEIQLYKTGTISLVDLSEQIVYYRDDSGKATSNPLSRDQYNHVTTNNKTSELLETTDANGKHYVSSYSRLSNGMILYLNVPQSEINSNRNVLIVVITVLTTLVCLIAMVIVWKRTSKIVHPIRRLAETANKYAQGEWDETYICNTGDELQSLSESIAEMADQTRNYIHRLNSLVRHDVLTGIRNRASYLELVEDIVINRHNDYNNYAVVVMDVNNLKVANDTFGHEAGDRLIIEASRYICKIFTHSAVFRIGGDEFVVILLNRDYEQRDELLEAFEKGLGYDVCGTPLSISFGMATPEEANNDYEAAFKLADDRMYKKKAQMRKPAR